MAISQQQRADLLTLAVGLFDAAPSSSLLSGLAEGIEMGATLDQYATNMGNSSEFAAIYAPELTNEEFASAFIANLLGADAAADIQAEGESVVLNALADGQSKGQAAYAAVQLLAATADERYADAQAALENKLEVADVFADETVFAGATLSQMGEVLSNVTSDITTVTQAKAAIIRGDIIDVDNGGTDNGGTDGYGDPIYLTGDTDRGGVYNGTTGNDYFRAWLESSEGATFNSLTSADVIDGGDGYDKLEARLSPEYFSDTASDYSYSDVEPTFSNIEEVVITARDTGKSVENDVTVDAKYITELQKIGSYYSDADLLIDNVNTLQNGEIRNTESLTVVMDHTAPGRSSTDEAGYTNVEGASDLVVYLDEDYLTAGQTTSGAGLEVRILNAVANAEGNNPVEGFESIEFTVGETTVVVDISSVAADTTLTFANAYAEVVELINAQLQSQGITTVAAEIDQTNEAIFSIPVSNYEAGDSAGLYYPIYLTNSGSEALAGVEISQTALGYDTDTNGSFRSTEATTTNGRVTINVELDKVGRDAEGGNLVIGAKDETSASTDVDQTDGIEVFKIDVKGDNDRPSNLGKITSTNQTLAVVEVSNGSDWDGADLTVRNLLGQGQELEEIDATEFSGDFSLAMSDANGQQALVSNFGEGNDSYKWQSVEDDQVDSNKAYSINMGAGDDTVVADLDGDSVDAFGESFSIVTGAGSDSVTLTMDTGVSQNTMEDLDNLFINTGSGNDTVNLDAYGNFDITTGAGDDFIRINSEDENGNGTTGEWLIGQASGTQTFQDRVLFQAELTVSFAGFEETVTVDTDANGNYVATQMDLNNAIMAAIDANTALSQLLSYELTTGTEQLKVTSTVAGENDFAIQLFQKDLVTTVTDADTQVSISGANISALTQGLLDTDTQGISSDDLDNGTTINAASIVANQNAAYAGVAFGGELGSNGEATAATSAKADMSVTNTAANGVNTTGIYFTATAGDAFNESSDSTTGINFSTINAGTGDDVIVLHSNDNSANTIVIDGKFDTASVVNYHDVSPNDVVDDRTNVGLHSVDFTAFLTNTVDPSGDVTGNSQSTVDIGVTLHDDNGMSNPTAIDDNLAIANSVNHIAFNSANTTLTWDQLNATNLITELNGDNANSVFDGDLEAAVDASYSTNIVESKQNHIIMVENDENLGEYKVFHVTSTLNAAKDGIEGNAGDFDTTAVLLGTIDFGNTVNMNLVGGTFNATTGVYDITGTNTWQSILETQQAENNDETGESDVDSGASSTVTVELASDTAVNDTTPTFTVTAETGSTVRVLVNGQYYTATEGTGVNAGTYTATVTDANALELGDYTVKAQATKDGVVSTGSLDFTVKPVVIKAGGTAPQEGAYAVEDTLSEILSVNGGGSAVLAGATTISIDDDTSSLNDEAFTLTGLTADAAGTAIDFTDNAATMTVAELGSLSSDSVALTDADAITVTGVADAAALATVAVEFEGTDSNDTVEFAGNEVTLTAAEYTPVFTTQGVSATEDDAITITTLDSATVAASAADDTFVLAGSDTGVSITGFTVADDTVALGGSNAAVAGTVAELADTDNDETLVFDTAANLGVNGVNIGSGDGATVNWAVASDTGAIYYDADGDWSADSVQVGTVGVVSGDTLTAADFTVA